MLINGTCESMQVLSKNVIVSCILWECNCFMYNIPILVQFGRNIHSRVIQITLVVRTGAILILFEKLTRAFFPGNCTQNHAYYTTYPKPSSCGLLHRSRCGYLNEKHDSKLLKTFDYILRKHLHLRKDFICEIVLISKRRRRCYRSTISSIYKLKNFSQLFKWKTKPKSPRNI